MQLVPEGSSSRLHITDCHVVRAPGKSSLGVLVEPLLSRVLVLSLLVHIPRRPL